MPGVLIDGVLAPSVDAADAPVLIARGTAAGGMAAKLQAAVHALQLGVGRVRIGDLAALGDPGRGTVVTLERSLV